MTKPCDKFGVGYQFNYEPCQLCNKKDECMQSTIGEGVKMQEGKKPNIPYAKKKQKQRAFLSITPKSVKMPFSKAKSVKLEIFIDVEWLRKYFAKEPRKKP